MQAVAAPLWFVIMKIIGALLGLLFGLFIILAIVGIILALAGDPGRCDSGDRVINISDAEAQSFQSKWDGLDAKLGGGQSGSISLTESEISSRAENYFTDENDTPVKDVVVCLQDGKGEGSGTIESPIGINAKVKISGTMALDGGHPVAIIDNIEVGGVPGFMLSPVEGFIEDIIKNQLDDINLDHKYQAVLTEGKAEINGTP